MRIERRVKIKTHLILSSSLPLLAQDAEMWLLNLTGHRTNEFVSTNQQGLNETQKCVEVIQHTLGRFRSSKANQTILEREITDVVANQVTIRCIP
jgi:hypothetical protein